MLGSRRGPKVRETFADLSSLMKRVRVSLAMAQQVKIDTDTGL
jgi:hypothetical protein